MYLNISVIIYTHINDKEYNSFRYLQKMYLMNTVFKKQQKELLYTIMNQIYTKLEKNWIGKLVIQHIIWEQGQNTFTDYYLHITVD